MAIAGSVFKEPNGNKARLHCETRVTQPTVDPVVEIARLQGAPFRSSATDQNSGFGR
jgi:hypothetical protein